MSQQDTHDRTLIKKAPPAEPSEASAKRLEERAGSARRKRERKARSWWSAQVFRQPRGMGSQPRRPRRLRGRDQLKRRRRCARTVRAIAARSAITCAATPPASLAHGVRSHGSRSPMAVHAPLVDAALEDDADADVEDLVAPLAAHQTCQARDDLWEPLLPQGCRQPQRKPPTTTADQWSATVMGDRWRCDSGRPRRRRRGRGPARARRPWSTHVPERSCA